MGGIIKMAGENVTRRTEKQMRQVGSVLKNGKVGAGACEGEEYNIRFTQIQTKNAGTSLTQ